MTIESSRAPKLKVNMRKYTVIRKKRRFIKVSQKLVDCVCVCVCVYIYMCVCVCVCVYGEGERIILKKEKIYALC